MLLPTKGFIRGDGIEMVDPIKLGRVLWARAPSGEMVPFDLVGHLSDNDLRNLNHVHERLRTYRKIEPILEVVVKHNWDGMERIKPYLMATLEGRSGARAMKMSDDWDAFWSVIN